MKQNVQILIDLLKEKYRAYMFRSILKRYSKQNEKVNKMCELCYMNGRVGGQ